MKTVEGENLGKVGLSKEQQREEMEEMMAKMLPTGGLRRSSRNFSEMFENSNIPVDELLAGLRKEILRQRGEKRRLERRTERKKLFEEKQKSMVNLGSGAASGTSQQGDDYLRASNPLGGSGGGSATKTIAPSAGVTAEEQLLLVLLPLLRR